ncbi:hypothetical protein N5079_31060 [Planotetraspora sp. A-T 1434]|uniref:hypothetical protein n=1 Tax=Planotetraspora sp. A-T 1434 TaxID=2979219 RepID=UPI0021BFAFD1|nr:hypothetical protein [Planotetraspora sp. A-T 1434]MCT9934656.1 hypothetical protein [Planotetraspora sp. A-T 1434]
MSRPPRDVAGALVALAVRLLPAARRGWGQAMRAELLQVEGGRARLGFALGCVRVALAQPAALRALGHLAATAAAVTLVLAGGVTYPGARFEIIALVAVLAALAWRGGRPGLLGPVGRSRTSRAVRAAGYALACGYLVVSVMDHRGPQLLGPQDGLLPGMITLVLYTVVTLAITARGSTAGPACLLSGIGAGLVAGLACFLVLPFERVLPPLADGLPGHGLWLLLVVAGAPGAAMVVVAWRTRSARQALMTVLCAGAVCAAVVALLGYGAFLLFPDQMPGIVPRGAGPPAVRHALSRLEAGDEYIAGLIWGCLLVAVLGAMMRPATRRFTRGLQALTVAGAVLALIGAAAGEEGAAVLVVVATLVAGMLALFAGPRGERIPSGAGGQVGS